MNSSRKDETIENRTSLAESPLHKKRDTDDMPDFGLKVGSQNKLGRNNKKVFRGDKARGKSSTFTPPGRQLKKYNTQAGESFDNKDYKHRSSLNMSEEFLESQRRSEHIKKRGDFLERLCSVSGISALKDTDFVSQRNGSVQKFISVDFATSLYTQLVTIAWLNVSKEIRSLVTELDMLSQPEQKELETKLLYFINKVFLIILFL